MNRSHASKIHYNPGDGKTLCVIRHGHKVTLTNQKERVTCKICLFYLGLYEPKNYYPVKIKRNNVHARLMRQEMAKNKIQRIIAAAGEQSDFLIQ